MQSARNAVGIRRKRQHQKARLRSPRSRSAALLPSVLSAFALGGNQGEVEEAFVEAVVALSEHFAELRVAPLYRTTPVGNRDQAPFLNSIALGTTSEAAEDLLAFAQALERRAGRRRDLRGGPRPLDLDLLFWGTRSSSDPELMLPHPRTLERRFVLQPLADLEPGHLLSGRPVIDWLAASPPDGNMARLPWRQRLLDPKIRFPPS